MAVLVEKAAVQHKQSRISNGSNALLQIASAYDGQTSDEDAPSAFHNMSLILNHKDVYTPYPSSSSSSSSHSPWSSKTIVAKLEETPLILGDKTLVLREKDVHASFPSSSSPLTSSMIIFKQEDAASMPGDRALIFNKDVHAPFSSPSTSRMVVVKQEEAASIPDYRTLALKRKDVCAPFPCTSPNSRMIVEREEADASVPGNRTLLMNREHINASIPSSSSSSSLLPLAISI